MRALSPAAGRGRRHSGPHARVNAHRGRSAFPGTGRTSRRDAAAMRRKCLRCRVAAPRRDPTSVAMVRLILIALLGAVLIAALAGFGTAVRVWLLPSDQKALSEIARFQTEAGVSQQAASFS